MINIEKAKNAFNEYVKDYNSDNEKILLKINHIKRVSQLSKQIATQLKLSQEDIELAELIGLLHDIGRFEQIKRYNTFNDNKSINHGELGVKILFEEGLIRDFIKEDSFDNIIKKAILNHNKGKIEEGLSERELLHCKIIRDSDKTDIFNVLVTESVKAFYETEDMSKEKITPEIYREFVEEKEINYKNRKTSADLLVAHFAYVFDFNFKESINILKEKNYIDVLYKRFTFEDDKTLKMYKDIYCRVKEYLYNY